MANQQVGGVPGSYEHGTHQTGHRRACPRDIRDAQPLPYNLAGKPDPTGIVMDQRGKGEEPATILVTNGALTYLAWTVSMACSMITPRSSIYCLTVQH